MTSVLNLDLASPFFGLALTVSAYYGAVALWQRTGRPAFGHPILIATIATGAVLLLADLPYVQYAEQTRPLSLGLGLVVVLLSVPLCRNWHELAARRIPCAIALFAGAAVAAGSATALPIAFGADCNFLATLLPKSATAAVAVGVSEQLGGLAGVTAVVVIGTGIAGAVLGPIVLDRIGVTDERARGFALGVASHAIGTARALQISDRAGAFAGLGMVLNAILTIAAAPALLHLIAR